MRYVLETIQQVTLYTQEFFEKDTYTKRTPYRILNLINEKINRF